MDSSTKTEKKAQEAENKMNAAIWNAIFFFGGALSGAWIIALGMAMAGYWTDDYFCIPIK